MFGRQQIAQVVSLDELARFIQQVAPQGQAGTTITIYVQELHVHAGGEPVYPMLGVGRYAELPARGCQVVDAPQSPWDYPPPQLRR